SNVKMVALDEADEMLDMGFVEDIEFIFEAIPEERQTSLFSATIPPRITALARKYLRDPKRVSVNVAHVTVALTTQTAYELPGGARPRYPGRLARHQLRHPDRPRGVCASHRAHGPRRAGGRGDHPRLPARAVHPADDRAGDRPAHHDQAAAQPGGCRGAAARG